MARVSYLDAEDLGPGDRELLARPINLFRALAHRPEVLRPFAEIGDWIRWQSGADPRRRELVILTVGLVARCRYEVAHHTKIAKDFGTTESDLDALFGWFARGDPFLAGADLASVAAARELAESGTLGDAAWNRLVSELNEDEALDLVLITAFYGMAVRALGALVVDNEAEFEPDARRFDELFPPDQASP